MGAGYIGSISFKDFPVWDFSVNVLPSNIPKVLWLFFFVKISHGTNLFFHIVNLFFWLFIFLMYPITFNQTSILLGVFWN